ncbi:MAG TPA: transglycosylase domain-containing protein [Dehalococcoidia bacterium]|jgi:membrane peptidoglycan carboxypeptidase|nr:transglycosylase domain-containing protein [Dehalococcoidia bacterium]
MIRSYRYRRWRQERRKRATRVATRPLMMLFAFPLLVLGFAMLVGATVGVGYYADVGRSVGPPEEAIAARGGGARIYDRNGTLLYEYLDPNYGLQRDVKLADISPWLQKATIAAEDASFYSNPGVNVRGLVRAATENLKPGDEFLQGTGGSSITQQLVKQIYFSKEERATRSIDRKVKEAILAVEITQNYDKDQILEWYLNQIPYGGVLVGIEAASESYFGIPAKDLSLGQSAFLAGLPQSPGAYDPVTHFDAAIGRQRQVIDLMVKHGFIDEQTGAWAKLEVITLNPKPMPFLAPHFVQYVGDYIKATLGEGALLHGGLEVTTTLDLDLNTKVNQALEKYLELYENSSNGHNGSVVIINPPTGQILAMVGSRDYFRDDIDGTVNNALALNSPGSTLKPFTYATTFMHGWGPEWPIVDTPINYTEDDGQVFSPRNPDGRTRGVVPLKQALGNSFNIPAFKAILWVGTDEVVKTAKAMGITTLDRPLGPAMTLGGVDVKLIDMVYGYSTFANNGVQVGVPTTQALPAGNRALDPVPVLKVTNRRGDTLIDNADPVHKYVMDPEYAYMITDILSNDENRQITYGRGSNLNIPGHRVAAKTGTSEPYEKSRQIGDTWTFGYTPDIAVGVWVGNSDNSPMVNILSTTIAGSTWHDAMLLALEGRPTRDWVKPDGIVDATVCVPSGIVAPPGGGCRTVTGRFAKQALDHVANWWGGREVSADSAVSLTSIPADITGWQRYLATEYLGRYFGASAPRQQQAAPPRQSQPQPAAPVVPRQNNGNGNGNGRR